MRLNLAGDSIETQLADLMRDIQELKTAQFTSQNSGMLAHVNRAALFDDFGDIIEWRNYNVNTATESAPVMLSHIPCTPTPETYYYNTIECLTQIFVPKHGKPAVGVPYMRLKAEGPGGIHGESEFVVNPGGAAMLFMNIYNGSNVKVGEAYCAQHQGDYLEPAYNATTPYAWKSTIFYTSTVSFSLGYQLLVRSSDSGITHSKLRGISA